MAKCKAFTGSVVKGLMSGTVNKPDIDTVGSTQDRQSGL